MVDLWEGGDQIVDDKRDVLNASAVTNLRSGIELSEDSIAAPDDQRNFIQRDFSFSIASSTSSFV